MKEEPKIESPERKEEGSPEQLRRRFLKKFGKYAVSTPVVTFTLMSAFTSKAIASHGGGHDGV